MHLKKVWKYKIAQNVIWKIYNKIHILYIVYIINKKHKIYKTLIWYFVGKTIFYWLRSFSHPHGNDLFAEISLEGSSEFKNFAKMSKSGQHFITKNWSENRKTRDDRGKREKNRNKIVYQRKDNWTELRVACLQQHLSVNVVSCFPLQWTHVCG